MYTLLGRCGGVCNVHHVAFTSDNMDTIEKLKMYTERVNNNQINDKQWHRTKLLKPKKLLSKLSHTSPYCCISRHKYIAESSNTYRPFKSVQFKITKLITLT